jgi:hypothetical protein
MRWWLLCIFGVSYGLTQLFWLAAVSWLLWHGVKLP